MNGRLTGPATKVRFEAVLFDLDDTLIPEAEAWDTAFCLACTRAAVRYGIGLQTLQRSVFGAALELWEASPFAELCNALGLWCPSSLLCSSTYVEEETALLRASIPAYQQRAWAEGLVRAGLPSALGDDLAESFRRAFATIHQPFADVTAALDQLAPRRLGIVTNGFADLQRTKLQVSGLDSRFEVVLISSELGFGKPDVRIYHLATTSLGVSPSACLMVGDSLQRDVAGATQAGLPVVWLDRTNRRQAVAPSGTCRIETLVELPALIRALESATR